MHRSKLSTPTQSYDADTTAVRLSERGLLSVRMTWIVLTLLILTLNAIMLPRYDAVLQASCQPTVRCIGIQLTTYDRHLLHQLGLSLGFVAAYQVLLDVTTVVAYGAVGALLFWRKSTEPMALFCAFMLVLFGGVALPKILLDTLASTSLAWFVLIGTLAVLGQSGFLIFFFLFPNGRFVPRWTRWVALCIILYWIYTEFSQNIFSTASMLSNMVLFALLLCVLGSQVYRYWRVSTSRERQQTKWVVYGLSIGFLGFVLLIGLGNVFLPREVLQSNVARTIAAGTGVSGFLLLIPISIAMAILRSHLYDIDTLVNRTLVYGLLTGLLGALYVGVLIGLESVFGLFATQAAADPVVLVISTLAVAALFQPMRRRIQNAIDRRFYRKKYDAEKTLAAFSATLSQEVDPEQLREQLLTVVQETMQPAHVSLWLRQPDH
ncbi:MAG: hypothetical protein ACLQUY_25140 [Ktedonobacterales bacterium]